MKSTRPVSISIPTPCHERWQGMNPSQGGRFCQSCQKTVLDFTAKTDREVALFFQLAVEGTCGRFRSDQLERPLRAQTAPNGRLGWLRSWVLLLPGLLATGASMAQSDRVLGKIAPIHQPANPVFPPPPPEVMGEPPARPLTRLVEGKITYHHGEPLIGATILLQGSEHGAVSDPQGRFELRFPETTDTTWLEISYTRYRRAIAELAPGQVFVAVKLEEAYTLAGEIVVAGMIVTERKDETLYSKLRQQFFGWKHQRGPNGKSSCPSAQPVIVEPATEPVRYLPETGLAAVVVKPFPNPFSDRLNLEVDANRAESLNVRILDLTGHGLFQQEFLTAPGIQQLELNLANLELPTGPLFVEVVATGRLVFAGVVEHVR